MNIHHMNVKSMSILAIHACSCKNCTSTFIQMTKRWKWTILKACYPNEQNEIASSTLLFLMNLILSFENYEILILTATLKSFLYEANKGKKKMQEDRYLIMQDFMGKNHQAIFGIFDGHSGAKASQFCRDTFKQKMEDHYAELKSNTIPTIEKIIKDTDEEFLEIARDNNYTDGSTCVLGLVINGKLTLANIGDSTALLIRNSNVIELTSEHNYSRLDEFKRIVDQNLPDYHLFEVGFCYRINGQLAVSRSIGDLKYKPAVTSIPEVQTINLNSLDQYLVLASDGIFTKKYNKKKVIEFIVEAVKMNKTKYEIANELVQNAIEHGSCDNATAIVIDIGELYQRWQRSTPFQTNMKYECPCPHKEISSSCNYNENASSLNIYNFNNNQILSSEKSRAQTDDTDMDIENNLSPFSGVSTLCYTTKFRNSDSMIRYPGKFSQHIDTPFIINKSTAQCISSRSNIGQDDSNKFLMPTSNQANFTKRSLLDIERDTRLQTISKRNKQKTTFKF